MTFSKEAYQTFKINNERVSFSCLKEKIAWRENVCESLNMFIPGRAAAPRETEQHLYFCVTGGPIQRAQQRPWRDLGGAT